MRVGRPVQPLPQPICDYCAAKAVLVRLGEDGYPYRDDRGPLWICAACEAWIGIFSRSTRHVPLGRLANAELRNWKTKLHEALEPLVAVKVRRDSCTVFEARAKVYRWLASEMQLDEKRCHINLFDAEQCEGAIRIIERFAHARGSSPSVNDQPPGTLPDYTDK
jgi:hypothetical protein